MYYPRCLNAIRSAIHRGCDRRLSMEANLHCRLTAPLCCWLIRPDSSIVTGRQARNHTWSFRRILSGHPVPILVQLIAVPCYVVARRPPNYEPDCSCYLFNGSYIASSSRSIIWSRKISRLSMFLGLVADTHK